MAGMPHLGVCGVGMMIFCCGVWGCAAGRDSACDQCDRVAPAVRTDRTPAAESLATADVQLLPPRQREQGMCPVTGEELGSMGPPVPVTAQGRTAYVCCEGCVSAFKEKPGDYLQVVDRADQTEEAFDERTTQNELLHHH